METPTPSRFEVLGQSAGVLLLVGITTAEMIAFRGERTAEVLRALGKEVVPFTTLRRESVVA